VRRYIVDQHLGGPEGLAAARRMLADRGLRLILDFVLNHLAPDHRWGTEHPDYFIQGNTDELAQKPGEFFQAGGKVLALGRDNSSTAWSSFRGEGQCYPFETTVFRTAAIVSACFI
jgi:glycosidase